jgi:shikimate kinase
MGAGKSSVGRLLAARFGLRFVDADAQIEAAAGTTITQLFEHEGEAGFRARERDVLAALLAQEGLVLATGGGAVLAEENRALMRQHGFVVHLHAGVDAQLARLADDDSRPLLARPDRAQVLADLAAVRAPLYAEVADLSFDTTSLTTQEVTDALAHALTLQWPGHGVAA